MNLLTVTLDRNIILICVTSPLISSVMIVQSMQHKLGSIRMLQFITVLYSSVVAVSGQIHVDRFIVPTCGFQHSPSNTVTCFIACC